MTVELSEREQPGDPGGGTPFGSVVIPAHNERSVIEGCLAALFDGSAPETFEVVVSCNGCTDGTAEFVRSLRYPVLVLETDEASKPAALRAADLACGTLPRLYLDADVRLSARSASHLLHRLGRDGLLAARPTAVYDTGRSSVLVRRFYRARNRVPGLHQSLWGAGVYGLSAAGRSRFDQFPDVVGDDLFVDRLFSPTEKDVVVTDPVVVSAPVRTADLLRMLRRSYRGKNEADVRRRDPTTSVRSNLHSVLRSGCGGPQPFLDAAVYVTFAIAARLACQLLPAPRWERDDSSRIAADESPEQ